MKLLLPQKPIFKSEDLQELFGVKKSTLTKLRNEGWLRSVPGTSLVRVPYPEVERYYLATMSGGER